MSTMSLWGANYYFANKSLPFRSLVNGQQASSYRYTVPPCYVSSELKAVSRTPCHVPAGKGATVTLM